VQLFLLRLRRAKPEGLHVAGSHDHAAARAIEVWKASFSPQAISPTAQAVPMTTMPMSRANQPALPRLLHAGHPDENYRPNAITLGASAPTLILEAVYFRSIYQTEHPRDWDIKGSNQEPSRGHTQNQAPNPSSPSTEEIGSQIAQGHAADGTKQSEQNNSNSEPCWVPLAQGLSAIAGLITTVGCYADHNSEIRVPSGSALGR
jgi:hypothetical protein